MYLTRSSQERPVPMMMPLMTIGTPLTELAAGLPLRAPWTDSDMRDEAQCAFVVTESVSASNAVDASSDALGVVPDRVPLISSDGYCGE